MIGLHLSYPVRERRFQLFLGTRELEYVQYLLNLSVA